MIAHIVLFRPRADLSSADRASFARALARAQRAIPSIRRLQAGRRLRHGAGYEQAMVLDFPYAAVVEFDDLDGLQAYLRHPDHAEVGRAFGAMSDATLVYDYEVGEASGDLMGA